MGVLAHTRGSERSSPYLCHGLARGKSAMETELSDGIGAFAMVPLPQGPLIEALRERRIKPADMALLWLLVSRLDWRTGRAWVRVADLATDLGHSRLSTAYQALARLRAEGLVARGADKRDPRRVFWCVNPEVACCGGKHRRKLQWYQFVGAL
jgi:hypothetical protein